MSKALRLLHLIDKNRLTTGSVVQMLDAARGLAERGHAVHVGGARGGDLEPACGDAGLPFFDWPVGSPVNPRSSAALRRYLKQHRIEIVHVHKGKPHAASLVAAAALGRHPRLVVNRGVSFPLDHFNRCKYRHPRVGAVVCVADAVREIVIQTGGLHPDRVHTIHGGTDSLVFDPDRIGGSRLRQELGLEPDHLVVGQVSVRDWKGWSNLLAAFASVAPRCSSGRLLFVGCEPEAERTKVKMAAKSAGVQDLVLTTGFRADMPEILAACDVVVDASWAGTGITGTIREAMAMEKAVVATDCGGNRELVVDGEVGLVAPPRKPEALAAALERLIGNPGLRKRLGIEARKRVVENFSTEKRIDKLEALYLRVLA